MTTRLALVITGIVAAAIIADLVLAGGAGTLEVLRRGFALLGWLAFWR
ncbi:MAG: hypothetical protein H3C51_01820 [Rubellimicrobium sp.]|nr:hypothetical protein [Rubellimicrobium sp.]